MGFFFEATITLPQEIINQLSAGTLTVTQAANGTEGIEPATASAAAILSQLNEMVQGQQQQQNTISYISNELQNLNRTQTEKVIIIDRFFLKSKTNLLFRIQPMLY